MRVAESVVLGARLGGKAEFALIVRAYEKQLYSFALASIRDRVEAEDAVQEVFLSLLSGIRDLREAGRFESWLWAVARNELASRGRARRVSSAIVDLDPDEVATAADEGGSVGEDGDLLLEELFSRLRPEEALAAALRYGGGLSVRELALVCGIPESTAKSRLDGARRRMRAAAEGRDAGSARRAVGEAPNGKGGAFRIQRFRIPFGLEERIMENVETLRLGAFIIERMANDEQMHLATISRRGEPFDERALAAIGRVKGGAELTRRVAARLSVKEFASMLNYTDRHTEMRIIGGLETVDPETSEELKRNMFVFEDFVLFDEKAIALLVEEIGEELFRLGLAACASSIRNELLGKLPVDVAAAMREAIAANPWSPEAARSAQEEAVAFARRLDQEGKLKVLQSEAFPRGWIFTVPD
jgi:RNA polymerase sigma factor (sigma-70 family)